MHNYIELTKAQVATLAAERNITLPRKAAKQVIIDLLVAADAPAKPAVNRGTGLKIEKDREERNGVKRPSVGGRCRAVWDALDAYQAETGEVPTAAVVRDIAADEGWNPNNASIEFYQWRKFNGISGRTAKPKVEKATAE